MDIRGIENVIAREINVDGLENNDLNFRSDLAAALADNIILLQESFAYALKTNDIQSFRTCIREMEPTLKMINQRRFSEVLEFLKFMPDSPERDIVIESFNEQSEEILIALRSFITK